MDNPDLSSILTIGAVIAAIYIGNKELGLIKELLSQSKKSSDYAVPLPPKTFDLETLDAAGSPPSDSSHGPQWWIWSGSGGQTPGDAQNWCPNCDDTGNSLSQRFYCWLYNSQPNNNGPTVQTVPGLKGYFKKTSDTSQNVIVVPAQIGNYYNTNWKAHNTTIAPTGTIYWDGTAPPMNPAFYMWYFQDALANLKCVGHTPDKPTDPLGDSPTPIRRKRIHIFEH